MLILKVLLIVITQTGKKLQKYQRTALFKIAFLVISFLGCFVNIFSFLWHSKQIRFFFLKIVVNVLKHLRSSRLCNAFENFRKNSIFGIRGKKVVSVHGVRYLLILNYQTLPISLVILNARDLLIPLSLMVSSELKWNMCPLAQLYYATLLQTYFVMVTLQIVFLRTSRQSVMFIKF